MKLFSNRKMRISKSAGLTIIMIISIVYHAGLGTYIWLHQGDLPAEINNRRDFLTSALQAIAAIIGIVFAISLVVIEHSASNYSPRILDLLKKDQFFIFTLSFGLFTIAFIGVTILDNLPTLFFCLSLFVWNLVLLGIYLWYILHKINPISVIQSLEFDCLSQIKKIKSQLPNLEKNMISNDPTGRVAIIEQHTPETIRAVVLKTNKQLLSEILDDEMTIQNIILEAFRKEEYLKTEMALKTYAAILKEYLTINPNYQWHDDVFIELIVGRFENFSFRATEKNDAVFLQQVILAFKEVGLILTQITPIQYAIHPPQPVSRYIFTCTSVGKNCVNNKMWDGALDSIRSLGAIGSICTQKYKMDGYTSNSIIEIGTAGLFLQESLVVRQASAEILRVIEFLIYNKCDITRTRMAIEGLRILLVNFQKMKLQTLHLGWIFFDIVTDLSIRQCAEYAFRIINEDFPQIETKWREEIEKSAISALIDLLGQVGIANRDHDGILTVHCAENLSRLASKCASQKFHTVDDGHKKELALIINHLYGFQSYDPEHNLFDDEQSFRLSEVAITCMRNGFGDLAKNCIEKIWNISIKSLQVDKYGYDANRMLRQLNLVGCSAIISQNDEILALVIDKIADFDKEYDKKFNELPRDELHLDQTIWEKDPFEDLSRIFDFKEIMKMENRKQFEYFVTKKRIEKLKSIVKSDSSKKKKRI